MERHCTIGDVQHLGRAWVLPHPERSSPASRRWCATTRSNASPSARRSRTSKRSDGSSRASKREPRLRLALKKPHPSEPGVFVSARFIEVKGRAGVGEVALSSNEYRTAQRLGDDYWLYVVFDCGAEPKLNAVQNPAKLGWEPVVRVEHYHVRRQGDSGGRRG